MYLNHSYNFISIDLGLLKQNLNQVRKLVSGKKVMGVVKKNAYGHGLEDISRALEQFGIDYLGVIYANEGLRLRKIGVKAPILIFGATLPEILPLCIRHDLELALLSTEQLLEIKKIAQKLGMKAKLHLKVDTGMGRIGISWRDCESVILKAKEIENIEIVGLFSHLACADLPGHPFTQLQVKRFEGVIAQFEKVYGYKPLIHMAASGGILYYPDTHFDMVRPGHLLYGLLPDTAHNPDIELQPILSLHTKVVFSKRVRKGDTVGYGNKWVAPYDTNISTLAIGYGDGYSRKLTGKRVEIIINDQLFPIIGSICMDQMMIDTGSISLPIGTEALIVGKSDSHEIHPHQLADILETVPDDIVSGLNWSIPRHYS